MISDWHGSAIEVNNAQQVAIIGNTFSMPATDALLPKPVVIAMNWDNDVDVGANTYPVLSGSATYNEQAGCSNVSIAPLFATVTLLNTSVGSAVYGQAVTLTTGVAASVSGAGPIGVGSVTFYDGNTALDTVSVVGGIAAFTTSSLPAGASARGKLHRRRSILRQQLQRGSDSGGQSGGNGNVARVLRQSFGLWRPGNPYRHRQRHQP